MSYQFKTNFLILTKQVVSATGNTLYVNGIECYAGVSGNLTQTGVYLENQINSLSGFVTGLSGFDLTNFATVDNLTQTGIVIEGQINSLSGWGASNINLATTGSNLYNYINNESGALLLVIQSTGNNLYNYLSNLSGQFNTNFATKINLTTTGQTLYSDLTGLSGQANINFATINNLYNSGNYLYNLSTGLSGAANIAFATQSNLTLTGQTNRNLTIGGDINLSGNLTSTGVTIEAQISSLSGWAASSSNLTQSGINLLLVIANTGQNSILYTNSNSNNLSGALTQSGISLQNIIYGGDNNISGNLLLTGQSLYGLITNFSGQANINYSPSNINYVYQTGNQIISGAKTINESISFNNNLRFNVSNVTGNFNFISGSYRYVWSGNSQYTGILPDFVAYSGFEFMIKQISQTGVNLLISGVIDYIENFKMFPMQSLNIWSNGQSWLLD